jgi:hypothetical protein
MLRLNLFRPVPDVLYGSEQIEVYGVLEDDGESIASDCAYLTQVQHGGTANFDEFSRTQGMCGDYRVNLDCKPLTLASCNTARQLFAGQSNCEAAKHDTVGLIALNIVLDHPLRNASDV